MPLFLPGNTERLHTQACHSPADSLSLCPQVEVEVESMDKAGNFIGWLHMDGANLSVLLVEHALSKVHFTAERSSYYKSLLSAEEAAKQKREKVGRSVGSGPAALSPALPVRCSGWCCSQTSCQGAQIPYQTRDEGRTASSGALTVKPPQVDLEQEATQKVTLEHWQQ